MMTAIVGRVVGVSLATSGSNIWISNSEAGVLVAAMLDDQPVEAARATSGDGNWIIVPQSARVDRALRDLRYMLDALIHDVHPHDTDWGTDARTGYVHGSEAPAPEPSPPTPLPLRTPADGARGQATGEGGEVAALAEKIRAAWQGGASRRRLALEAGYPQYGGSYVRKIEEAIEYLQAEAATTPGATTGGNGRGDSPAPSENGRVAGE